MKHLISVIVISPRHLVNWMAKILKKKMHYHLLLLATEPLCL